MKAGGFYLSKFRGVSEIGKRNRQKKSISDTQTTADNVSQILTGVYGLKAAGMYVSPLTALGCSAVFFMHRAFSGKHSTVTREGLPHC